MEARERRRLLRLISLANKHSDYAETLGIRVNIRHIKDYQSLKGEKLMMYYLGLVTDNPHHNHEVHKETCPVLPVAGNREYLGDFSTSRDALNEAKRRHPSWYDIDGCAVCCPEIHTK